MKQKTRARKSSSGSFKDIEFDETEGEVKKVKINKMQPVELQIKEFRWTEKQQKFIDLCLEKKTNYVFNSSVAGTGKTLCSIYVALKLLCDPTNSINRIIFIRQPVESSTYTLGFLKGELSDKMAPYMRAALDSIKELLINQIDFKKIEPHIESLVVGHVKSLSFHNAIVIVDEFEDVGNGKEIALLMSRIGKNSKMIFIGDPEQSNVKDGCAKKVFELFSDPECAEHGIHCVKFDSKDIKRNPIIGYVLDRLKLIQ